MELLKAAPPPAYWLSQLAEDCAACMEVRDYRGMQDKVLRESERRHLTPLTIAKMIGEEWDRTGVVRVGMYFPGMR